MKRNQIKRGRALMNEGLEILEKMKIRDRHDKTMDAIHDCHSDTNEIEGLVTEICAIGFLMTSEGDAIFNDMLNDVEYDMKAIADLVSFINRSVEWNTEALIFVGDNSLNPNVKREVATFLSEVEPDGGL